MTSVGGLWKSSLESVRASGALVSSTSTATPPDVQPPEIKPRHQVTGRLGEPRSSHRNNTGRRSEDRLGNSSLNGNSSDLNDNIGVDGSQRPAHSKGKSISTEVDYEHSNRDAKMMSADRLKIPGGKRKDRLKRTTVPEWAIKRGDLPRNATGAGIRIANADQTGNSSTSLKAGNKLHQETHTKRKQPKSRSQPKQTNQRLQLSPKGHGGQGVRGRADGTGQYRGFNLLPMKAKSRRKRESNEFFQQVTTPKSHVHCKTKTAGFSERVLQSCLEKDPLEALSTLVNSKEECRALLNQDKLSKNAIRLMVRVLSSISRLNLLPARSKELNTVLDTVASSSVVRHLARYLVDLSIRQPKGPDREAKNPVASEIGIMLRLIQLSLQRNSAALSEAGRALILLQKVVTQSALDEADFDPQSQLMTQVQQLMTYYDYLVEPVQNSELLRAIGIASANFRDIPIFPDSAEVRHVARPFLEDSIIQGRYGSVEHYLHVQFRLLREDFVAPLRERVAEYLSDTTNALQDTNIYHNVFIEQCTLGNKGFVYTLRFDTRHLKRVHWKTSKGLRHGSLVCLTKDKFQHILCASVENRNPQDLEKGLVDVQFLNETAHDRTNVGPFIMVESVASFEISHHVLRGLQHMKDENFPFKKYIVDVASSVDPPAYLRNDDSVTYDFRSLTGNDCEKNSFWSSASVPVLDLESWPPAEELHLDESQRDALQAALTEEFAVIQGLPGTGKTYIGLKIIQILLSKKVFWKYRSFQLPILVVCHTGQALDQLLERLIAYGEENVIRVGGGSSTELMKSKSLSCIKRDKLREHQAARTSKLEKLSTRLKETKEVIQEILLPGKALLHVKALRKYMNCKQYRSLSPRKGRPRRPREGRSAKLLKWLNVVDMTDKKETQSSHSNQENLQSRKSSEHMMKGGYVDQDVHQTEDSQDKTSCEQRIKTPHDAFYPKNAAYDLTCIKRCGANLESSPEEALRKSDTMTSEEARGVESVWSLKLRDRWRLYKFWIQQYVEEHDAELTKHLQKFDKLSSQVHEIHLQEDFEILREANVIGVTTDGAAKCRSVLQLLGPPIVLVEEAAEVLEAHIITTLTKQCQHLILIGDHQQLKPNPTVYRLAKMFNLDTSLYERMISNGVPCHSLTHQHRMRPEFSGILKKHFYNTLENDESVMSMDDVRGVTHNMFFVDCQGLGDKDNGRTAGYHQHEAKFIVELCKYLLLQGYKPSQITILAANLGELCSFRRLMDAAPLSDVRVCAVDQGEEHDIVLLSLVGIDKEGAIEFKDTSYSFAFGLSKARVGFYCIGNASFLKKAQTWQSIMRTLEDENRIGPSLQLVCQNHPHKISQVASARDFTDRVPCGGCDRTCEYRLPCGHACVSLCHPCDPYHKDVQCEKRCTKLCIRNEHSCPFQCHEECAPCEVKVRKLMSDCGHVIQVSCHEFEEVACTELCPKVFEVCGHHCRLRCGQNCPETCPEKCVRTLACGHFCTEPCGKPCTEFCKVQVVKALPNCSHDVIANCGSNPEEVKCRRLVKKNNPICGHGIIVECCENPGNVKCRKWVSKTRQCGHRSFMFCYEDPSSGNCKERCAKILPCGHRCPNVCCKRCAAPDITQESLLETTANSKTCKDETDLYAYGRQCDATTLKNESGSGYCTEKCEKLLRCGHPCPNKCGEPCPQTEAVFCGFPGDGVNISNRCEEVVQRMLPTCGHSMTTQCYKDIASLFCSRICNKELPCGHQCTRKCSEPCVCKRKVLKRLPKCGHVVRLSCHQDVHLYMCNEKCQKQLVCGHQCPNKCGELCPGEARDTTGDGETSLDSLLSSCVKESQALCAQIVIKKLPGCGHDVELPCHKDVSSASCSVKCGKVLSCGHRCPNRCGEPCPSGEVTTEGSAASRCLQPVRQRLPLCGHVLVLPCTTNPDFVLCPEKCEKILPCGHRCPNKCGQPCPGEKHALSTEKAFIPLGTCTVLPSLPSPSRKCEKLVQKRLTLCGHMVKAPCHQNDDSILCFENCEKELPCGHRCPNKCSQPCPGENVTSTKSLGWRSSSLNLPWKCPVERCEEIVEKVLACGHVKQIACWQANSASNITCEVRCGERLKCGHACSGNCKLCKRGKQHKLCREKCNRQLVCGHMCDQICAGICSSNRAYRECRTCTSMGTNYRQWGKWGNILFPCKHNTVHRQLGTSACTLPCSHKLRCGHLCIGVCGEPCPRFCVVCNKETTLDLIPNKSIIPGEAFIYLPDCYHLCEVRTLDKMVAEVKSSLDGGWFTIRSLLCPKCKEPIRHCPRYEGILEIINKQIYYASKICHLTKIHVFGTRFHDPIIRSDKRVTASMSLDVGRWVKCPKGHVFCQEDGDEISEKQKHPHCPYKKCSQ